MNASGNRFEVENSGAPTELLRRTSGTKTTHVAPVMSAALAQSRRFQNRVRQTAQTTGMNSAQLSRGRKPSPSRTPAVALNARRQRMRSDFSSSWMSVRIKPAINSQPKGQRTTSADEPEQ